MTVETSQGNISLEIFFDFLDLIQDEEFLKEVRRVYPCNSSDQLVLFGRSVAPFAGEQECAKKQAGKLPC